jgi:hypothetical protein
MFDPAQLTLGQLSSAARDISIVGALVGASWKLRGVYETITKFFERTMKHMDTMESGMNTLLTNHLAHIEASVEKMSNNQSRVLSGEEVIHVIDEEASGK